MCIYSYNHNMTWLCTKMQFFMILWIAKSNENSLYYRTWLLNGPIKGAYVNSIRILHYSRTIKCSRRNPYTNSLFFKVLKDISVNVWRSDRAQSFKGLVIYMTYVLAGVLTNFKIPTSINFPFRRKICSYSKLVIFMK